MRNRSSFLFKVKEFIFLILLVAIDQASKYWAKNYLQGHSEKSILPMILSFEYLEGGNTGAAWGIFSGNLSFLLFFNLLIVVALFVFLFYLHQKQTCMQFDIIVNKKINYLRYLIILLIAGALGNIIDRIRLGYVIDFITFKFISFPIFNVADCFVVISAFLLLLFLIFGLKEEELETIFSKKEKKH